MKSLLLIPLLLGLSGICQAKDQGMKLLFQQGDKQFSVGDVTKGKDGTIGVLLQIESVLREETRYRVTYYSFDCKTHEAKGKSLWVNKKTEEISNVELGNLFENTWNTVMPNTATHRVMMYACNPKNLK